LIARQSVSAFSGVGWPKHPEGVDGRHFLRVFEVLSAGIVVPQRANQRF